MTTTAQDVSVEFSDLPDSCPYTISRLFNPTGEPSSTWLIREHDRYGEYPHIYAKVCEATAATSNGHESPPYKVIVLSDSGCGTDTINQSFVRRCSSRSNNNDDERISRSRSKDEPSHWNIHSFLLYTLNPGGKIPYMVITSHCHYDHISGIAKLPPTGPVGDDRDAQGDNERHDIATTTTNGDGDKTRPSPKPDRLQTTVLTSSLNKDFVTPYSNLQEHSLSPSVGMHAPRYKITWAEDMSEATWRWTPKKDSEPISIGTGITLIQTPGHTPDSLSWYDQDLALLFVGDSFYVKESNETRSAPWGPEPPMPTMFDLEGDLADLWSSIEKLLCFVRVKNEEELYVGDDRATVDEDEDVPRHYGEFETGGRTSTGPQKSTWSSYLPFVSKSLTKSQPQSQQPRGFGFDSHTIEEDWVMVVDRHRGPAGSPRSPSRATAKRPRVRLAAAHTTVGVDAEDAILSFREFLARILRDRVPKKRMPDGFRGEERWLYDFDLEGETGTDEVMGPHDVDAENNTLRYLRQYSVLAPLKVIEKGREKMSEFEMNTQDHNQNHSRVLDYGQTVYDVFGGPSCKTRS